MRYWIVIELENLQEQFNCTNLTNVVYTKYKFSISNVSLIFLLFCGETS